MARAVLKGRGALELAALILAFAATAPTGACSRGAPQAPREVPCSSDLSAASDALRSEVPAFRARLEAGPFYRKAVERHGPALRCELGVDGGALVVSYRFPRGGEVHGKIDPALELSELSLTVSGLADDEALALLRAEEEDAYGKDGCGIRWEHSEQEPSILGSTEGDRVYRGEVCNCQARMAKIAPGLVRLHLRSTC